MYKFRALVYHAPPASGSLEGYLSRLKIDEVKRLVEELSKRREVWSVRIVCPPVYEASSTFNVSMEKFLETFYDTVIKTVNYVAFPLSWLESGKLAELMLSFERAYFSVVYSEKLASEIIKALREIPEKAGWLAGSRFAISFGKRPVTSYFPVTTSETEGYTLSLLYPSHVEKEISEGMALPDSLRKTVLDAYRIVYDALDNVNATTPFHGIDLSLSPWQKDSVASFVEKLQGIPFGNPGTISTIKAINEALLLLASSLKTIGFNEVMLPLAEDDRLKELASTGQIAFKDFLYLTLVCVVGLDMIPLPSTTDDVVLRGLIRDLETAKKIKGRTLGMRILLVDAEPGTEVDLGFFGRTPVLDPLC
ncbi:MAG: DUF711 family protein [Thermofilaceae archaeon]